MKIFKAHILFFLLTFVAIIAKGQNLVLNPSFENINSSCSSPPYAAYPNIIDWDNPDPIDSCSTPDWYSSCLPAFFPTHAPNAFLGTQSARTGISFAGFIGYDASNDSYREYVEGKLSSPLVAGQNYSVNFYLSHADTTPYIIDKIGVYLSDSLIEFPISHCDSVVPLPYSPQLEWVGGMLSDETNWVELQWNYIATGGEQYLTIGNFYDNTVTTAINVGGNMTFPFAYYFIDDVGVVPVAATSILTNELSSSLVVSPNPANDIVSISSKDKRILEFQLYTETGKLVLENNTIKTDEVQINTSTLSEGFYFLKVRTSNNIINKKIAIVHYN